MSIRIVPLSKDLSAAVVAFNQRMRAAGSPWGFYADSESEWIPKRPDQTVWREYYVALDDQGAVRGGFVLKPQDWWIHTQTKVVTDWQGPFSEGSVNPQHASLAVRLIRDMVSKRPALYSWGHGGAEQPMVKILRKMNWLLHETPFCLLVLRPARFLRFNALLRETAFRRTALDILAFTGAGAVGFWLLHGLLRLKMRRRSHATGVEFTEFGEWADNLWETCKNRYAAIAVRDAASMNVLAPSHGWPPVIRLRVERSGTTIGWALVMATQMRGDARFGDLFVGSIVDCFSDPNDTGDVILAATEDLRRRGVDIIVSNQSHPAWIRGFRENGYLAVERRRLFVASPELRRMLEPFAETAQGLHLTNMDGHGPHGL